MSRYYALEGRAAVALPDDAGLMAWAEASEARYATVRATGEDPWRVARTEFADGSYVSTVFLGLDHGWGVGPPLLFETMVFDSPLDGEQERCSTWAQAEEQHAAVVARVEAAREKGFKAVGGDK